MRLFIAIEIAPDIRDRLVEYVANVKPQLSGARWARPEGLHITLKFLGHVSEEQRASAERKLSSVAAPRFELSVRGVGVFPSERSPRVLWAGLDAPDALPKLAESVERAMESLGFSREQRAYSPHVTIARFTARPSRSAINVALETAPKLGFGTMAATQFHLYESKLSPQGSRYSKLATFTLD